METSILDEQLNKWVELMDKGKVSDAQSLYNETIFQGVIDRFVESQKSNAPVCNILFSILGFTPEPIILTQRLLQPEVHIIFTTKKKTEVEQAVLDQLNKFLTSYYQIIYLADESFDTIYKNLHEQMIIHPSVNYTIDITGGKKSMVASAAIFARDNNCCITYVDYDVYLPKVRRPMPGTERLNVVYSVKKDLPLYMVNQIQDEISFTNQSTCVTKNNTTPTTTSPKRVKNKPIIPKTYSLDEIKNLVNNAINTKFKGSTKKINGASCRYDLKERKLYIICNDRECSASVDEIASHLQYTHGIISRFFGIDKYDKALSTICEGIKL